MFSLGERGFHLWMGGLMVGAIVIENALPRILPIWRGPEIGLLTVVVGLVWVGRYAAWRAELDRERSRVLEDRIARLERAQRALEDDVRERLRRPI